MSNPKDYTIGWICALKTEYLAAQAFLDEKHDRPETVACNDNNDYTLGKMGKHNVVIAVLPSGDYGRSTTAVVVRDMISSFPNVRIGLMVGIGSGAPSQKHDIRLGDIVVSAPSDGASGVFQYDFGDTIQNRAFKITGFLNQSPMVLRTAVRGIQTDHEMEGHQLEEAISTALKKYPRLQKTYKRPNPTTDRLYKPEFVHPSETLESCDIVCSSDSSRLVFRRERGKNEDDPAIHYGLVASANNLMKDALLRDSLAADMNVLCFEMEAAGLMNNFPCLIIRGICDYADSHTNKEWQGWAAMTAAAYAKNLVCRVAPSTVKVEKKILDDIPSSSPVSRGVTATENNQNSRNNNANTGEGSQHNGIGDMNRIEINGDSYSRYATYRANGDIRTQYNTVNNISYQDNQRPLRQASPSSTVPFRRDPDFVDTNILSEIHEKCSVPASRVALVGLGGVGKSQLAIEYSYRSRETSPNTWVFWVHASTAARFEEGYRTIAETVKFDGWDKSETNILNRVSHWLRNEDNGHWIMIIDNADDEGVFFRESSDYGGTQAQSLSNFLPQTSKGRILITSRSQDVAFRLIGRHSDIMEIKPMDQPHAIALLEKKLPEGFDRIAAIKLARSLDHMPLALSQAAAYITQSKGFVTVSKYLHKLEGDQNRERLLRKDFGDLRRAEGASNAIMNTWEISFDHIRKIQPSAARLLSFMSLFDRQGIPHSLLLQACTTDGNKITDIDDDILILANYSLVIVNEQEDEFEMHRLVQVSTKAWLQKSSELDKWIEKYINVLNTAFPAGAFKNWSKCKPLFPHAYMVLSYKPESEKLLQAWSSILAKAATYSEAQGRYEQAEEMGRLALSGREKVLGKEHPDTLTSVSNLASLLRNQGKYEQAEEMNRVALLGKEKVLGKEHPDTLTSMSNLALVLSYQDKYEQAEEMNRLALSESNKVLGKEHPGTLASMDNLASLLRNQGKYEQAEEMNRLALSGYEKVLGKEHPDTLTSVSNLALVLNYRGKYEQAEEMNRIALSGSKKVLGKEHPDTLTSMDNLASLLRDQGKYEQAEEMNRLALSGREKVLGKEHPDTLTSMSNLALVLSYQDKYEQAEEMNRLVLSGREKVLGKEHPGTLASMSNLASLLSYQGRYQQAEEMNRLVLSGREKVLGKEHPGTLAGVNNLALVLRNQGKYEQAEELHRLALSGSNKVLGKEHPDTLTSVSNLALVLRNQGKYEQAEELNRLALSGRKKVLGKEHPDTLASMDNLASLLRDQDKYEQAEEMNRLALSGYKKVLGKEHPDTLKSVSNLALVLRKQGKYEQAEAMNRLALSGREKVLGKEHSSTLTSVSNLASVLEYQSKYEQAEEMNRLALSGREKVLGKEHPDTLTSMSNLALVLSYQDKYEQAEEMNRLALSVREKVLGKEHPDTLASVSNLASLLRNQGKYEQAEEMNRLALSDMRRC